MNDDFLHQFRRPPRREFVQALAARLAAQEKEHTMHTTTQNVFFRRLALAGLILCLGAALLLAVSPAARAAAIQFIQNIAGYPFEQVDHLDGSVSGSGSHWPTARLEEIQRWLPFELRLPAWVPEGFVLNHDEVIFGGQKGFRLIEGTRVPGLDDTDLPRTAILVWEKDGQVAFALLVSQDRADAKDNPIQVGSLKDVQEVEIHGNPAPLVKGTWELKSGATFTWKAEGLTLFWQWNGLAYQLMCSDLVSSDDLVRIAESIP
jgi:hypothetical protein